MSTSSKAFTLTAVAIGLAVIALVSYLSVSNGELRRELTELKSDSGSQRGESSRQVAQLEKEIDELDRQVQDNVEVANANYKRYNKLVKELNTVVGGVKTMSKSQLLAIVERIKKTELSSTKLPMELQQKS